MICRKSCLWEILLFSANLIILFLSVSMALSAVCASGHLLHTTAGISVSGMAGAKFFLLFPPGRFFLLTVPDMGHQNLKALPAVPLSATLPAQFRRCQDIPPEKVLKEIEKVKKTYPIKGDILSEEEVIRFIGNTNNIDVV